MRPWDYRKNIVGIPSYYKEYFIYDLDKIDTGRRFDREIRAVQESLDASGYSDDAQLAAFGLIEEALDAHDHDALLLKSSEDDLLCWAFQQMNVKRINATTGELIPV